MSRKLEGTCSAYLTSTSSKIEHASITSLVYFRPNANIPDWYEVGTAHITVELNDDKEIVNSQVDSLKKQQKQVQAEAECKVNELQYQINSLLCLEYIPKDN